MLPIHITECPVCSSQKIQPVLNLKDHSVSGEAFVIWECVDCSLRFTQDIPDQQHIGPYYKSEAYISHTDTTKGFINTLYHQVRKFTLRSKRKLVEQTVKSSAAQQASPRLLDVGAGTAAFLQEMKTAGWQVTGLEPDPDARAVAMKKFQLALQEPAALFQLETGSLDIITLWHVLEHVHELQAYIRQFHSLLKPNGKLLIAVPNYTSADAAHYGEYWAAYDVPRHLYHFSPKSMRVLLERNGFRVTATRPMWFDSFYVSLLSEGYKKGASIQNGGAASNGRSNPLAAFGQGLLSNFKAINDRERASSLIYVIEKS